MTLTRTTREHARAGFLSTGLSVFVLWNLATLAGASLIEVKLVTGKRNQIRIQARLRGHTLVGEKRYTYGPDALRRMKRMYRDSTTLPAPQALAA